MPYTFTQWKEFHSKRGHHKVKDYRTFNRDVRVRDAGEQITFHYSNSVSRKKNEPGHEVLLATLTQHNVLTFHFDFKQRTRVWDTQTICNRITNLLGVSCSANKRSHARKESHIRFFTGRWTRRDTGRTDINGNPRYEYLVLPRYDWTNKTDIPYNPGVSFQLNAAGEVTKLLHAEPDRRKQVKPDMAKNAKADTAVLRKLVIAMARMGSFNHHMTERIGRNWSYKPVGELEQVNYHEPTGDDAEIVFTHGMHAAYDPPQHVYENGQYRVVDIDQRMVQLRTRAIENGMKLLRHHIYQTQDGYETVEV